MVANELPNLAAVASAEKSIELLQDTKGTESGRRFCRITPTPQVDIQQRYG
jgi:hypothetical protein